jgi:hypothetical protein
MTNVFEQAYPLVTRWVNEFGWIEIGDDNANESFIRALDEGGMVWEGRHTYPSLDEAMMDLEKGIAAWMRENNEL